MRVNFYCSNPNQITHNTEPRKHQIDNVIRCLRQQCNLAREAMSRAHYLPDMRNGIGSSEERSV